jgi:hypothetical protein
MIVQFFPPPHFILCAMQRSDEARKEKKRDYTKDRDRSHDKDPALERDDDRSGRSKVKEHDSADKGRSKRDRSRSPLTKR